MKINNKDLQRLYKDYIRQKSPSSRKNCPPLKKIINFFNSKSLEKQKFKIIDHITTCSYCLQEFEFILQTLRYKLKINEEISDFLNTEKVISTIRKKSDILVSDLKKRQSPFFPKLSWKYGSLLLGGVAAAIILIIIFFKPDIIRIPVKNQQRSETITQIKLIEPIGAKYSTSSLSFKWRKLNDSDYYILELFDESLIPVWKSEKILKNHYTLPKNAIKNLDENKVYFWMVTAFLSNGKKIESTLEEFTLLN